MKLLQRVNNLFRSSKKQVIATVIVILLSGSLFTMNNQNLNRIVRWHDDFVGWIVGQELDMFYLEAKVSDLPDLKKLELDAELIRSIKDLKYFHNLEELTLNAKNVENLDALQQLKKLDKLIIINGDMKTLKYISKLNISTLELRNFTLSNVKLLTEMTSLSCLEIIDSYIEDGSAIKELSGLSYLSLANVETQYSISLCESGNYNQLYLSNVEISNLDILNSCINLLSLKLEKMNLMKPADVIFPASLQEVTVKDCGLTNLDMFLSLPDLLSLDISNNKIEDIINIEIFCGLKKLSLANNPIDNLMPIGKLKDCTKLNISGISINEEALHVLSQMQLEVLEVSKCGISDLSFLTGHTEVKRLDLSDNEIKDIKVLSMYRNALSYLNISGNPINDLSPLKEWAPSTLFYDEKYYCFEGVELDVSGINLGKIAPEKGSSIIANMILNKLVARNCGLKTAELVAPHTKLHYLDISGNPIKSIERLNMVKCLKVILAKDTLITAEELPGLSLFLTSPKTYGITALWKMPGGSFSDKNECKKEWIRIVIE